MGGHCPALTTAVITAGLLVPPMPIAPIAQTSPPTAYIYSSGRTAESGKFIYSDAYIGFRDEYIRDISRYTDNTLSMWSRKCTYSLVSQNATAKAKTKITYRFRGSRTRTSYTYNYCDSYDTLNGTIYRRTRYNPPIVETRSSSEYRDGMASAHVDVANLSGEDQDFGLAWTILYYARNKNLLRTEEFEDEITVPNGRVCTYCFGPYPITRFSVQSF